MAFSKITAVSMGTGAAGVGSVGIVGGQLLSFNKHAESSPYVIDDIVVDEKRTDITFKDYGCFKKFFPGVEINKTIAEGKVSVLTDPPILISPSTSYLANAASNTIGCANMKMSYKVDALKGFMSGEIVIKGDKAGLALGFEGFGKMNSDTSDNSSDYYQELLYRTAFLETSKENNWEAKTGYSGKDTGISTSSSSGGLNIYVKSPDKEWINVNHDDLESLIPKRLKGDIPLERFNYFGVWEYAAEEDDKHPFSEIKVGKSSGELNILGKVGDFSEINLDYKGGEIYDVNSKKWKSYKRAQAVDLSSNINSGYEPFKGKKGKWKPLANYCSETNESKQLVDVCEVNKES